MSEDEQVSAVYWRETAKAHERKINAQAVEFRQRESRLNAQIKELEDERASWHECYMGAVRTMEAGAKNEDAALARVAALEREVAMLKRALQPFAHHSLPGFWTESDRELRIRVTEGQLCRAWMALNNPRWIDEEEAAAPRAGDGGTEGVGG